MGRRAANVCVRDVLFINNAANFSAYLRGATAFLRFLRDFQVC